MKFYWSQNDIPELKGLSPALKKKAKAAVVRDVWKHWQVWLPFLAQFILIVALALFLPSGRYRFYIVLASALVTANLAGLPFNYYLQRYLVEKRRSESAGRDAVSEKNVGD